MSALDEGVVLQAKAAKRMAVQASSRSAWLKHVTRWHWISSAFSLVGMLFFALTGITLNHAALFENSTAQVTRQVAVLPPVVLAAVNARPGEDGDAPPAELTSWLAQTWHLAVYPKGTEWRADEVFIDLKRPGVDASLSLDRHSGAITYEAADRGWVAWLNELHRGRNAGGVWSGFITFLGVCCVVFCITGLLILQVHARSRWSVWPITGLGLVVPLLLVLLFIH